MNAEIVFSGLCSFLNIKGENDTMTEPSVILVRTDHHMTMPMKTPGTSDSKSPRVSGYDMREPKKSKSKTNGKHKHPVDPKPAPKDEPVVEPMVEHVAFIAFNTLTTKVTADPAPSFEVASPQDTDFQLLRLDGVQIEIEDNPPGTPNLPDDTYHTHVVRRDDYWPAAKNKWNRDFVPEPGGRKPDPKSVIAYLRFGKGDITAGKLCPFLWRFPIAGGFHEGNFAEEVVYSNFPHSGDEVVLKLTDLQTGALVQTLRFSAQPNTEKITIFIGNNMKTDIGFVVTRTQAGVRLQGNHFQFLNKTADPKFALRFPSPLPLVGAQTLPIDDLQGGGGGIGGGPCGPNNGNGSP